MTDYQKYIAEQDAKKDQPIAATEVSYGENKDGRFIEILFEEVGAVVRITEDQANCILTGHPEEVYFQDMKFTAEIPSFGEYIVIITSEEGVKFSLSVNVLDEFTA